MAMDKKEFKILVVDDQPSNLRCLSNMLTRQGYKVQRAISGQLALNAAIASPPDLILLDLIMPEMDGYEVCQSLKSLEITSRIPIIFLSVLDAPEDKVKALKAGGVDYITKPFQVEEVLARIETQLTLQTLQNQLKKQNQQLQQEIEVRKQAEAQARLLDRAIAASSNGVVITDATSSEQPIIYVNPGFEKMTGYTQAEVMGQNCRFLQGPDTDQQALAEIRTAIKEERECSVVLRNYRKDGTSFWNEFSISPVRDESGNLTHYIGIQTDITERKQAEEELRQQKELLQTIFDHIPVMISLFDAKGQAQLLNRETEQVLGWSLAELADCDLLAECYPEPEYRQQVLDFMLAATGKWQDIKLNTRSGQVLDTCWANIRLSDGRYIGIGQDITERKQAEEALRKSEERFQLAMEASSLGLWDWNLSRGEVYFDPHWKRILGYEVEEIENRFQAWERLVHPEDLPNAIAALNSRLENGWLYKNEFRMLSKSGEWRWILSHANVTERDESGKPIRITGTHKDISDRKHSEEVKIALIDCLEQSEARLSRIITTISEGLIVQDERGIILFVNPAAVSLLGKSYDELLNQQIELPAIGDELTEVEILRPSGELIIAERRATKINWDNKAAYLITLRDLTQRKQAEAALQQSEARLQKLAANVPGMLYEFLRYPDGSSSFTYASSGCREINEIEPDQLLENPTLGFGLTHPDDLQSLVESINISAETLEPWTWEGRIVTPSGKLKWIRGGARPELYDNGSILWHGLIVDVSDRKQAEAALRESEERFRAIADSSSVMLWVADGEAQCTFFSKTWLEFTGRTLEQELGQNWLECVHPDDRQRCIETYLEAFAARENFEMEYRLLRFDGEYRWIVNRGKPRYSPDSIFIGYLGACLDITERKLAEAAVQQSEARLQKLTANVPGMIYEFVRHPDGSYGFAYLSSGCREIYELEPEQLLENAASGFEQVHPDDIQSLYEGIASSAQHLAPFAWEGRLISPSGKLKWIQATSRPEPQENGYILWHGVLIDVSDRKFSEALLRDSQQRLSFLVQQTPLAIVEWNNNLEILAWNRAAQNIFGYSEQEALGQNVLDLLVHESIREQVNQIVDDLLHQQGGEYSINDNITKEGKTIICEWYNTALVDGSGQMIGGASMAVDITERYSAEAALRESAERERALAKAIDRIRQSLDIDTIFRATVEELRQAINCDRVAIYRFNLDWSGEFVAESVGSGWISLLQAPQEDLTLAERTLDWERCTVKQWDSADSLVEDTYLQETAGGAYSRGASHLAVEDIYQAEFTPCYINLLEQFQAKAYITVPIFCGSRLWGLLASYQNSNSRQWKEAEINIVVQIGTQLGIALQQAELLAQTRRVSLELMKAKDAADAANRAKSQFLAKMSHELRTPLNAILGFSQILARSDSLSREQLEHLNIINRSGEHLLDLINDVLSMAKIEAGQVTLNENRFDLYRLLDTIEEMLQLKAQSKSLQLTFKRAAHIPQYIETDESKLRQVLINLLGNAIKFTTSGSVTLQVSRKVGDNASSCSMPHVRLVFEVSDTGPGIAPEELPTLFKPFVQTQTGRQSMQGTGLGLPISQQFVRLMGGDIAVRSQLGEGTTFSFDIQASLVSEADEKKISTPQRIIGLEPNQPNYRLLVAEDIPENRRLLIELLVPLGFEVLEAENGQQAVALCQSWQPHLIWMDMEMPVMDGYEATKQIKRSPKGRDTVIIALTASAFEEQRLAILRAGCDDFICKPFREEVLFEKMTEYLGVTYVYAEDFSSTSTAGQARTKALTRNDLSIMSREWVSNLYQAALAINDRQITDLLQQIPETHSHLAKALANLVENFRLDVIIELTQPHSDE